MVTHIKTEFDHNQYHSTVCSNEAYSVLAMKGEHVNSFVDQITLSLKYNFTSLKPSSHGFKS